MQEISGAVQEGAKAYLTRQYTIIAGVAVVLAILLIVLRNVDTAIGFAIGGVLSGAAGFIGMNLSVRAHSRGAEAALRGEPPALARSFIGWAGARRVGRGPPLRSRGRFLRVPTGTSQD